MLQKVDSKIYIIGAGFAGQMIARDLMRKKVFGSVAAFLDDEKKLIIRHSPLQYEIKIVILQLNSTPLCQTVTKNVKT